MSAQCLSHDDGCMNFLEVSEGGRLVRYIGRGRDDSEAASVRSNLPLAPVPNPFGYFEGHVVDQGRDGYMSIGLMNRRTQLDKLVGWGEGAVGYHGDDGNIFVGNGMGRAFGPLYGKGDIIGCGIDWINGKVFFTKNGSLVGCIPHTFQDEEPVFAAIGLRTPGETFRVNFGQQDFVFNMEHYISECRKAALAKYTPPMLPLCSKVLDLVISHCIFNGYAESVQALVQQNYNNIEEIESKLTVRRLQLQYIEMVDNKQLSLHGIENVFPQLQNEGRLLYRNLLLVQNLISQQSTLDELLSQVGELGENVDSRILALLSYSGNLELDRPRAIINDIYKEFKDFLTSHPCVPNELYNTLTSISSSLDESAEKGESVKIRRLWKLLNNQELFIPKSFFD